MGVRARARERAYAYVRARMDAPYKVDSLHAPGNVSHEVTKPRRRSPLFAPQKENFACFLTTVRDIPAHRPLGIPPDAVAMSFRSGRRDAASQNETSLHRGFKEIKDKDFKELKDFKDFKDFKEDGSGGYGSR